MTPFAHLSNEELISLAYRSTKATPLELEFAFRLENQYADSTKVSVDEPVVQDYEDIHFGANSRG